MWHCKSTPEMMSCGWKGKQPADEILMDKQLSAISQRFTAEVDTLGGEQIIQSHKESRSEEDSAGSGVWP